MGVLGARKPSRLLLVGGLLQLVPLISASSADQSTLVVRNDAGGAENTAWNTERTPQRSVIQFDLAFVADDSAHTSSVGNGGG